MYYKNCKTCANKSCLKTKTICNSMDNWLNKYVEVSRKEKLGFTQDLTQTLENVGDVKKLYGKHRI